MPNDHRSVVAEHTRIVNATAYGIRQRALAQGWKGARANSFAIEAAAGALAATLATHGDDHPVTNAMSLFAYLVALRGLTHVNDRAAQHIANEAMPDEPGDT